MTLFIQNDATGAGAGNLNPDDARISLSIISNLDTGLGQLPFVGNRQEVTYVRTLEGIPPTRLDDLVNTNFNPDYGSGPQTVPIVLVAVLENFTLNDGRSILTIGGTALPPQGSGLAGADLNNTNDCLVIYDTTLNNGNGYCVARDGTGGTLDLEISNPMLLYHELSHASRVVTNSLLALSNICDPSSPEENAAIVDENDIRTQIANTNGETPVLRDPGIHCGGDCGGSTITCCIIASVASGSPLSPEVAAFRSMRDGLLRKSEIGFAFFQSLHHDYYGFSPQVSKLMAQHPALRPLVLEGFVRPLVSILHLIELYALGDGSAKTLGEQFIADHIDRESGAMRLNMICLAHDVLNGDDAELTDVQRELARLLYPALESEHLKWSLVEPFQIYQSALHTYLNGCATEQIGKQMYEAICSWAGRMPLDDVWASLAISELQGELEILENLLLHTPETRASFRDRLQKKFDDVTAVEIALRNKESKFGGNE